MPPERTDEELLAAYQEGDVDAFERLLDRHRAPLFTFLLRLVGDRERAEDLMQEAFLRIVAGAAAGQAPTRFKSWLYAVARNLCLDQSRRDRLRRMESLDTQRADRDAQPGSAALVDRLASPVSGPERAAHSGELRPLLVRALESLPTEQREVFLLREQTGASFKEIAELVGAGENTVKSRMRYAVEGLRRVLAAAQVDDAALEFEVWSHGPAVPG